MRKIETIIILFSATAALFCLSGSIFASFFFIISSTLGLIDSIKNKAKTGVYINSIFLTMNTVNSLNVIATFLL